ncbi:hypothetical protein VIGAN_08030300 [Vigna angularis var. angularis]|uniref:Uncharacterized protein n=1 Tax=Vigna angularis var. angularis TaxID=157739 RepID=A0A0S3SLP5_PHAAN|nr:hypothetical protein VIGAN_08030300 [Vigna angularis var. angularis]
MITLMPKMTTTMTRHLQHRSSKTTKKKKNKKKERTSVSEWEVLQTTILSSYDVLALVISCRFRKSPTRKAS